MRVFITGGTGFIGSHIVIELLKRGDDVTILARNPQKIPAFQSMAGTSVVAGGLDDVDIIRKVIGGHDACIHNALYWEDEPTEFQLKDTRASVAVFEAAAEAGVSSIVYTSSTAVHRPFQPHMDESTRLTPTDFYAATKAAGEAFLSAFSYQTSMRCNVVRPGPTVGKPAIEGGPIKSDRRLAEIARAACAGEEIRVAKHDGRQFVGASDLAKLFAMVLHSDVNRETFIGVASDFVTWEQIAREAVTLAKSTSRVCFEDQGAPQEPPRFDVSKIERCFGLSFNSIESLKEHLAYLLSPQDKT